MVASHGDKSFMETIGKFYMLKKYKENKIWYGLPIIYIGSNIHKYRYCYDNPIGTQFWSILRKIKQRTLSPTPIKSYGGMVKISIQAIYLR